MGLARTVEEAALTRGTPKVAMLYRSKDADVRVQAYSMGLPHPSLQLTGAICLSVALCSPGTIAYDLTKTEGAPPTPQRTPSPGERADVKKVKIAHSQGSIGVSVVLEKGQPRSCAVSRTARRLFAGKVRYYD
jgi:2-methylaconitate cis-trans-isomerase PrpF